MVRVADIQDGSYVLDEPYRSADVDMNDIKNGTRAAGSRRYIAATRERRDTDETDKCAGYRRFHRSGGRCLSVVCE